MSLSTIFRAAAVAVTFLVSAGQASAQSTSTAITTHPAAPPVAAPATPEAMAIAQAMALCMPEHLSLTIFEQHATTAGWTTFRTAPNGGHIWRLSDRNADATHRVSVAAASYEMTGAPKPTHEFSCKIALQPGSPDDFAPSIAATFGDNEADGGFFILERTTLRPLNFNEALTPFPASLGNLQPGQRMVFMETTQRQGATIVSVDSFEASGTTH